MSAPASNHNVPASWGFGSTAIHAGSVPDPITGAVVTPISLATTFIQRSPGEHSGYEYSRTGNPTRHAFESCVAACEGGKYGLAFSSGSAVTATLMHLLNAGDHIIASDDLYGGTNRYFRRVASPAQNLDISMVDLTNPTNISANVKPSTKMIWVETPTNPTLKIVDIAAVVAEAKKHNLIVVADNTFASPYNQSPLKLGADVVMHSVTKYIGGHSDVVMGVLATNSEDLYTRLKFLQNGIGAVPAPFDCYMAQRGLKTLHLRMREHNSNALAVAKFLEAHPQVEKVLYPGLESHPQHALAKRQMHGGFGGMVTFFIKGGLEASRVWLENLKLFALAESLGAVESLAEHPGIMTHASVPPEQREKLGISDSLIRLSVGCENIEDILADLTNAFNACKK